MTPTPVYLEPKGKLSFAALGNDKASSDTYVSDPAKPVPYTEGCTL